MKEPMYKVILNREIVMKTKDVTSAVKCFQKLLEQNVPEMTDEGVDFKRVVEWNDGSTYVRSTIKTGKM